MVSLKFTGSFSLATFLWLVSEYWNVTTDGGLYKNILQRRTSLLVTYGWWSHNLAWSKSNLLSFLYWHYNGGKLDLKTKHLEALPTLELWLECTVQHLWISLQRMSVSHKEHKEMRTFRAHGLRFLFLQKITREKCMNEMKENFTEDFFSFLTSKGSESDFLWKLNSKLEQSKMSHAISPPLNSEAVTGVPMTKSRLLLRVLSLPLSRVKKRPFSIQELFGYWVTEILSPSVAFRGTNAAESYIPGLEEPIRGQSIEWVGPSWPWTWSPSLKYQLQMRR